MRNNPIYLHFLDRELSIASQARLNAQFVESIIKSSLLTGDTKLYCSLSLIWESPWLDSHLLELLQNLIAARMLDLASPHTSSLAFLESRRDLYAHDKIRYPYYFSIGSSEKLSLTPNIIKDIGTTSYLSDALGSLQTLSTPTATNLELDQILINSIKTSLLRRDGKAITFSIFNEDLQGRPNISILEDRIRRIVSSEYSKHYISIANGSIITGIPSISIFDNLSNNFPFSDFAINTSLIKLIGLGRLISDRWINNRDLWNDFFESDGVSFNRLHIAIDLYLRIIYGITRKNITLKSYPHYGTSSRYSTRVSMDSLIRNTIGTLNFDSEHSPDQAADLIQAKIDIMSREAKFATTIEEESDQINNNFDVIILTVNEIETKCIIHQLENICGAKANNVYIGDLTIGDYGFIRGARVGHVRTGMGSTGPLASAAYTSSIVHQINPRYIISTGIAFGIDKQTQYIGDVLISRQIALYEPQRIGQTKQRKASSILRGDTVSASRRLIDRFMASSIQADDIKTRDGLILTGDKLIDNSKVISELRKTYPEALGGEMEAAGLYSLSSHKDTNWIVIKGICDWADGNKKKNKANRQNTAATNAARLVALTLDRGGFAAGPH